MKIEEFKFHEGNSWDRNIVGSILDGAYGNDFTDKVVVDIGANIGGFTALSAETAKIVYAFEPDKENFRLLQENTKKFSNVKLFDCGIGDKGKRTLYGGGTNYGNYSLTKIDDRLNDEQTITCYPLSHFKLGEIDFLKCDCEGAEYEIFKEDIPAKEIIIEAHFVYIFPEKFEWLQNTLKERGYMIKIRNSDAQSSKMIYAEK